MLKIFFKKNRIKHFVLSFSPLHIFGVQMMHFGKKCIPTLKGLGFLIKYSHGLIFVWTFF